MNRKNVSVVIRAFNEERHIGKLLQFISQQKTNHQVEIVVVDSGSTDATLDIAKKFNPKIVHISSADFTFGRSLNLGIENSEGEFCIVVSAHCYPYDENWIELLIESFSNEKVALVYGKQRGNVSTKYSEHQIFAKWFPEYSIADCTLAFCNNANSAIRKSIWETKKFDESLTGLEDLDWAKQVKKDGFKISYCADACVYHIHEETWKQVFQRYYREALAYKEIYRNERFGLYDFLKFFILNTVADYLHSIKDGKFLSNIISIPIFRFIQFGGTFRAHRYKQAISHEMQRQIFYPRAPSIYNTLRAVKITSERSTKSANGIMDITRPLSNSIPVWPGSKNFEMQKVKEFEKDALNESQLYFNTHTGTHMDAPSHFLKDGGTIRSIELDKVVGDVIVVEHMANRNISSEFLDSLKLPSYPKRIIFKSINSLTENTEFDENFVALEAKASKWLAERNYELVGVDGPSVQGFHDNDNGAHKYLLEKQVVVLEGLTLAKVELGKYKLVALPLNIPECEGAPVRAILINGNF